MTHRTPSFASRTHGPLAIDPRYLAAERERDLEASHRTAAPAPVSPPAPPPRRAPASPPPRAKRERLEAPAERARTPESVAVAAAIEAARATVRREFADVAREIGASVHAPGERISPELASAMDRIMGLDHTPPPAIAFADGVQTFTPGGAPVALRAERDRVAPDVARAMDRAMGLAREEIAVDFDGTTQRFGVAAPPASLR